jgi:hypothetical protein
VHVAAPLRTTFLQLPPLDPLPADEFERQRMWQIKRQIHRSRIREVVWISVAVAEVTLITVLVVLQLMPR